jgi:YfiH family protein
MPAPHLFTSRDLVLREDQAEWAAVAASIGVPADRLRLIKQVHGVGVAIARAGRQGSWSNAEADIILTDDPSVAVGVRVADCAPILLYDPERRVAGAAHAGWRGTASRAAVAAVRAMEREFGSRAADLIAAIGPCLGRCCGEVGPEVVQAFADAGGSIAQWFTAGRGDRSYLDLERANRDQLGEAGLSSDRIFASGLCTKTYHQRLHSYRAASGTAGRLLGAIRVPPPPGSGLQTAADGARSGMRTARFH